MLTCPLPNKSFTAHHLNWRPTLRHHPDPTQLDPIRPIIIKLLNPHVSSIVHSGMPTSPLKMNPPPTHPHSHFSHLHITHHAPFTSLHDTIFLVQSTLTSTRANSYKKKKTSTERVSVFHRRFQFNSTRNGNEILWYRIWISFIR